MISICRHQFCCNNTKGRIEEEAIMLFISIFRSTSTQPCRNGICKWFSTQEWFWCKFKLFFSHLFLFLGEINIFQLSSLTELQKDWHHLVLNLEKVQWKLIICCWWIIVESILKKKISVPNNPCYKFNILFMSSPFRLSSCHLCKMRKDIL